MLVEPTTAEVAQPQPNYKRRTCIAFVALFLVITLSAWKFTTTGQPPFLHRQNVWSIAIYEGASPLALQPLSKENTPVLTAGDVTDVDALFVADPFMIEQDGVWYLFIEILNKKTYQGDIGVAVSHDQTKTWQYKNVVLDEAWHLSYPSVFQWDDQWYMLPQGDTGVHLYEAEAFPNQWRQVATLMEGTDFADPTLFRHDDQWWMFLGKSGSHDRLQLFFAKELTGPWTEHPQSPIIESDPNNARPGGKVIEFDGSLYRFAQDCDPKYGNQLRAYKILELNRESYREVLTDAEFVLQPGTHAWNANGMHHLDAHQLDDGTWRGVVDGHKKVWTLGWKP